MKTENLKKLKEECNLTTKQISDLSGIPESTISRILSGQTDNPTFDNVSAIVKAMGGSLDSIAEVRKDSDTEKEKSACEIYERIIKEKNWYIKILITICCTLVAVLIFLIIYDAASSAIGFIRY
ncbi:MAG: helix-turn-helix domain-containing protein [Acutalibacteraceae bacterium]